MHLGKHTKEEIDLIWNDWKQAGSRYLMLTGGVGVGKSLYAKILSNRITDSCMKCNGRYCGYSYYNDIRNNDKIELFSFGSHYSRENFIYGLSVDSKDGKLLFKEEESRFIEICKRAENDRNPGSYYAVIFDDINRSDISQTLGDMLSAMESKDVGNEIHAGDKRITLPDNLYIIATANPLVGKDKLDYAWMRRFMHYNILPDERHFGFDFDGDEMGDGYRCTINIEWEKAYINYNDSNGKINDVGIAFLRNYQWDIFMHIKIMYERYFYDPNDKVRRDQYIPGHGMFLTYFKNKSYGCNLAFFQNVLRFQVVPLLWKYMDDGILTGDAILDIEAIADVAGEEIKKKINSGEVSSEAGGKSPNAKNETKLRELIKNYEKIKWSEWYLFIACNLYLRRIDRRSTPKLSNIHITRSTIWCYLIEREFSIGKYFSGKRGKKDILLPCHNKNQFFLIDNVKLLFPQQVTKGREYVLLEKKPQYVKWDKLTEILSKTIAEINERNNQMSNIENEYIKIMDDLSIKQMILQGPPGTSKTYGAKYEIIGPSLCDDWGKKTLEEKKDFLKNSMIIDYEKFGEESGGWDMVQFHPSYCYEDFVRGITVSTNGDKQVVYETVNKVLGKMCKLALKYENKEKKFFLIIDEINRADIATVFGELIYALECREEEVSIPYAVDEGGTPNYKLNIPDNLYIIGTMNTADKSIGTIDYAIRRRFLFFDCQPDEKVVESYIKDATKDATLWQDAVYMMDNIKSFIDKTINKNYHAKDLYIGHTYFLVDGKEKLVLRLQYQILPILREYYENGILTGVDDDAYDKWTKTLDANEEYVTGAKNILKKYLKGTEIGNDLLEELYKFLKNAPKQEGQNDG